MLKKSFFPIFQYKLGFHANPPPLYRNALKKCVFNIYTLENIKIHKTEFLGTLKFKLEFFTGCGGVHENPIWLLDYIGKIRMKNCKIQGWLDMSRAF